jgi:DNA-binding transcriptional LysR family regulator
MSKTPRALRNANLNLIPVLRALLREASVTRASESLGLSQSATSGALARLRDLLGDPILVQVGRNMRLTPRARELVLPLEQLCGGLEELLRSSEFDPASTEREFVVAAPDFMTVLIGNRVVEAVRAAAPKVTVYFADISGDLAERFNAGSVDLAIINFAWSSWKGLNTLPCFTDRRAAIVSLEHPLARIDNPTEAQVMAYPQVRWRGAVEADVPNPPEAPLSQPTFTRQFTVLPLLALDSDSVAVAPRMFAEWMAARLPLKVIDLPVARPIRMGLTWSPVHEADAAQRWFRRLVEEVMPKDAAPWLATHG